VTKTIVIDTNVILVANGQHEDVSAACEAACTRRLYAIKKGECVVIDDGYRILKEYQLKTSPHLGKRAGDAFLKWLLQNKGTAARCSQVTLKDCPKKGFESFPEDKELANFDPPDRKFVAVAAAHFTKPPIAQAADSKWLGWAPALRNHGIIVDFVCQADIESFDKAKKSRKGKPR
jgi:hypothetical protein